MQPLNLPKILSEMWTTRRMFYRPDPLGYCVIMQDMIRIQKYLGMSVEERQIMKGYTKKFREKFEQMFSKDLLPE